MSRSSEGARALNVGPPESVGVSPERVGRVKDLARSWVDDGYTPSLVVLAARRGTIFIHEAFGKAGPGPDAPALRPDAIFPMASITKPITATAVMCLVEDGLLGLTRKVADYIPEFRGEGTDAVMVHHLLTHTSGLRDEDLPGFAELVRVLEGAPNPDVPPPQTPKEVLSQWGGATLWKPPGQEMVYCNLNYSLLGGIVVRLSGHSLDRFARDRIFAPLGMDDTHFLVPEALRKRVLRRDPSYAFPFLGTDWHMNNPTAAGGVYSTALDIAVFAQMCLNGGRYDGAHILSRTSVGEMTRNQIPGIGTNFFGEQHSEASWGYGWSISGNEKWRYYSPALVPAGSYSHGGAGGVHLWVDPAHELVGVYLSVLKEKDDTTRKDLFANAVTAAIHE